MDQVVIVIVACHFKNPDELCPTTIKRLEFALRLSGYYSGQEINFIVTGPVAYHEGGKTLSELMREWLVSKEISEEKITIPSGVGIFSEARNVTYRIKEEFNRKKFHLVTSDWYLIPGGKIWSHFASENRLKMETYSIYKTGGIKTRLTYLAYGVVVWTSFLLGINNALEKIMTRLQSGRLENFKFNGCR